MKNSLFNTAFIFVTVALVGCSGAPATTVTDIVDDTNGDTAEDHHEGETNVAPHDDNENVQPVVDDHHAGEENVEPHDDDEEDKNLPPSRSRLEDNDVGEGYHEDEENTEPHGH